MDENSVRAVEGSSLFVGLTAEARRLILDSLTTVTFPFGAAIVEEGKPVDGLFIIQSGRARALRRGEDGGDVALNVLRAGDSFGETALLGGGNANATIRASTEVSAHKLEGNLFRAILKQHPDVRAAFERQAKNRALYLFLRSCGLLCDVPAEAWDVVLDERIERTVAPGEVVIQQGDSAGSVYLIREGRLRAFVTEGGERRYLQYLRMGDSFGEVALYRQTTRTASVEAMTAGQLWEIQPETFKKLLARFPRFRTRLEERVAQNDYQRVAKVPLDFSEELLPAQALREPVVSSKQVEQPTQNAEAPFRDEHGRFAKRKGRVRRVPFVAQVDAMDCGAASLAMICRHFGRPVSLARIRQLIHTSVDGTSLRNLVRGATTLGLAARSAKVSRRNAPLMPLPAVVHWEGNHWLLLLDLDDRRALLADPASGHRTVGLEELFEKWSGYAALFDYTDALLSAPVAQAGLAWLWPHVRKHSSVLARAAGLALVASLLEMTAPLFTQVIVDHVLLEGDHTLLGALIGGLVAVLLFSLGAKLLQRYLLSFVAVRVDSTSLDYLMRRMMALPVSYFAARKTGDIQRRVAGVRQVRQLLVQKGVELLTQSVQLVAAVGLMLAYNVKLALVYLAVLPLYAGLMRFSSRILRPLVATLEAGFGRYYSYQLDAIKGIEAVKTMGAESRFRERMLFQFHQVAAKQFDTDFTRMAYHALTRAVGFLAVVAFLWLGANEVIAENLTIGAFVAFNALVMLANAPSQNLLEMWDEAQEADVLLNRLSDIFEYPPEQGHDKSALKAVKSIEGRVRFQRLSFHFPGQAETKIIDGVDLEIPAGKRVAVVGRSGSGKTTLVKCLAGLIEPTEGAVLVDGVDIRTLDYQDLRRNIGYVLQDNYLFDDTIARNIAFSDAEPDMDRVLWAARAANAHGFIERLPLGYETSVGESGLQLSGGQKQRIAIARALYLRPAILIFDEATSALDTESERAVQEGMEQLLRGRTSFLIAHRLSTIRDADLILVLERGKVAELGAHDELMERRGLYYYLVSQQMGA